MESISLLEFADRVYGRDQGSRDYDDSPAIDADREVHERAALPSQDHAGSYRDLRRIADRRSFQSSSIDNDADGTTVIQKIQERLSGTELKMRALFKELDANSDGTVSAQELQSGLSACGLIASNKIQQVMRRLGDKGRLRYSNFVRLISFVASTQRRRASRQKKRLRSHRGTQRSPPALRLARQSSKRRSRKIISHEAGVKLDEEDVDLLREICYGVYSSRRKVRKLFKHYMDTDGSGALSLEELVEGLHNVGVTVDEEDVEDIHAYFDTDGTGSINYSQFMRPLPLAANEGKFN